MKTLELTIRKTDLEDDVAQATSYTGAKDGSDPAGGVYDRVATIDGDSTLLGRFIEEACSTVAERLKDFVTGVEPADDAITLRIATSEAYDTSMIPAALRAFRAYVAATVTARWMRLAYPAKAPEWDAEADRALASLERNLYHRKKPSRPQPIAPIIPITPIPPISSPN